MTRISVVEGLGPFTPRLCGATEPLPSRIAAYSEAKALIRAAALEHLSFQELLKLAFEVFDPAVDCPWNEQA